MHRLSTAVECTKPCHGTAQVVQQAYRSERNRNTRQAYHLKKKKKKKITSFQPAWLIKCSTPH